MTKTGTKTSRTSASKGGPKKTEKLAKAPKVVAHSKLENVKAIKLRQEIPQFKAGDKVIVKSRVKEGDKERLQAFEGVVIGRKGRGIAETFTVRKVSAGVGVERVFPLHAPTVASIEVKVEGFVRRQKLYYLRGLEGKASRIRDRNLKLSEAQGLISGNSTDLSVNEAASSETASTESGQTNA